MFYPSVRLNNIIRLHLNTIHCVFQGSDRFGSLEVQFAELRAWLTTKMSWLEQLQLSPGAPMKYEEFTRLCADAAEKRDVFGMLRRLQETNRKLGIAPEAWHEVDTNWQKVEAQLRHWQWLLDTALPGEFGQIGEWLNQGEALVHGDDVPAQLNEEAAAILNQKIEDHKAFFRDLGSVQKQFATALQTQPQAVAVIPKEQLDSLARRLREIGPKSDVRAVRLKFLEHKCCIVAFLLLTETKLKNWTVKYGREEKVAQIMAQYKTFVSKNKIFQEFQKAYVEFQEVCKEYKKDGHIGKYIYIYIFTLYKFIVWKHMMNFFQMLKSLSKLIVSPRTLPSDGRTLQRNFAAFRAFSRRCSPIGLAGTPPTSRCRPS